jgi:hypothetical protein
MSADKVPTSTSTSSLQNKWRTLRSDCPFLYSAVLCNPVLILHAINGVLSLLQPNSMCDAMFDTWISAHLDMHADDNLCRAFTVLMVALQLAIYRPGLDDGETSAEYCG